MTISNRHEEALARADAEVRATTARQARLDAELAPLRELFARTKPQ